MEATFRRPRRKYVQGRCDDCGRLMNVTRIYWWAGDFQMDVCRDCIKPYRDRILAPCTPDCVHSQKGSR